MIPMILTLTVSFAGEASDAFDLQYVGADGADRWAVRFHIARVPHKDGAATHGYTLRGTTTSGKQKLTLESVYGPGQMLRSSRVTLRTGDQESAASVTVASGRARVVRPGQTPQDFEVSAGVIVTSAPDWTDIAMLCARYDRDKGGKQAFAALWIHPTQPAQLLQLTIERKGRLAIRAGKLELTEFLIHLRNQSAYRAWATGDGTLVRLAPLMAKGARAGLFQKGYEADAAWRAAE
jgi:hypothetical protein